MFHMTQEILLYCIFQYGVSSHLGFSGQGDSKTLNTPFSQICDKKFSDEWHFIWYLGLYGLRDMSFFQYGVNDHLVFGGQDDSK